MTHAPRKSTCHYCGDLIEKDGEVVIGKSRVRRGHRTFTFIRRWHPLCWVENGRHALSMRPRIEKAGRPRIPLSPEERLVRVKLLRKHGQYMYQYREYMEAGRVVLAATALIRAHSLKDEIEKVGGVPRSWVNEALDEPQEAGNDVGGGLDGQEAV